MKKYEDGRIGFNSSAEHRMVERARHHLKNSGIEDIKTVYHDYFTWIVEGILNHNKIRIYILMRKIISNKVAMNRGYYELERIQNNNPLLILSDRRHKYPVKFIFSNNINSREYKDGMTPFVLISEEEFKDISELKKELETY